MARQGAPRWGRLGGLLPHAMACLLLLAPRVDAGGRLLDEVLASVNGQVICRSDLALQRLFEELGGRPEEAQDSVLLQRMIDRCLVLQEIRRLGMGRVDEADVAEREKLLRGLLLRFAAVRDPQLQDLALARLRSWLTENRMIQKFVDLRFGATVTISEERVEAYLAEHALPGAPGDGRDQETRLLVEELLRQRAINDELARWLASRRERAVIEMYLPSLEKEGGPREPAEGGG